MFHCAQPVRHDDESLITPQGPDRIHDTPLIGGVERTGGFVHHQNLRVVDSNLGRPPGNVLCPFAEFCCRSPMKILFIAPAPRAGTLQYTHNLANALGDRGHDVALATGLDFELKGFAGQHALYAPVFDQD